MKKKVTGFIILFVVCSLGLFSSSFSNAYNIDDLYEYALQMSTQNVGTTEQKRAYSNLITYYNKFKNIPDLQNCSSLYCYSPNSTFPCNIFYWNDPFKVQFNSAQTLVNTPQGGIYRLQGGNVNFYGFGANFSYGSDVGFGLLDLSLNTQSEIDNFNWSHWYLNNKYQPPPSIVFVADSSTIVTIPTGQDAYAYKPVYTNSYMRLGYIEDYSLVSLIETTALWYNFAGYPVFDSGSFNDYYISDSGVLWVDLLKVYRGMVLQFNFYKPIDDSEIDVYIYFSTVDGQIGGGGRWWSVMGLVIQEITLILKFLLMA